MSKRPTPKRKMSQGRSGVRYKAFARGTQVRLENAVVVVECPQCHQKMLNHHACPTCGTYRGRPVISKEKELQKITKIKA